MQCPNCGVGVRVELRVLGTWSTEPDAKVADGYALVYDHCPECRSLLLLLQRGPTRRYQDECEAPEYHLEAARETELLYPANRGRRAPAEVPEPDRTDFAEASAVLSLSPKASAALSRRILQGVLRQAFGIRKATLAQELAVFLETPGLPSYLRKALDAVRNIGNLAVHPEVDAAGTISDVEPGEAEWLIETIEALFDYAYVQPAHLEARRSDLNERLRALGKPELKG